MILVSEIIEDAKRVFGHCAEKILFRWITDAVQLLANKGEVDPLVGHMDMCVVGSCISLPTFVETVLAVNLCGHPTQGRDEFFSYHLNGPGDHGCGCSWEWVNTGSFPTYRDIICPSKLIAFVEEEEDAGSMLKVLGYDEQNRPLRTKIADTWMDGHLVPTIFNYALPASTDPVVSRITQVIKDRTVANVRLSSFDNSTGTGTLLGIFEPNETKPLYRRIKVCGGNEWVRIAYRKKSLDIVSLDDVILLHSRPALILAMHAIQKYREADLGLAVQFEAQATRLLSERESVITAPVGMPIQVVDLTSKLGAWDDID